MELAGDDLEAAFYVVERFIEGLRAGGPPVPKQVNAWFLKVRLAWEMSGCGHENDDAPPELAQELIDTAEVASVLNVTTRQVRRLVNDLDGRKHAGVWLFPRQTVIEYAERRTWPKKST
ncbi:hypothetical protein AWB92_26730 [Mycobacterium sp. IEC1808]|nr:hypothetical protein AWB92_26730 [Mycobacterium sp. IEC1808]